VRDPENPIPPDETLFRTLPSGEAVKQLTPGQWIAMANAVDLRGSSFQRGRYCPTAEGAVKIAEGFGRTTETDVVSVTGTALPTRVVCPPSPQSMDFFSHHCPDEAQGEAHCEVRTRKSESESIENDKPKSSTLKAELRRRLADQMCVVMVGRVLVASSANP